MMRVDSRTFVCVVCFVAGFAADFATAESISQYEALVQTNVMVSMRDGIKLVESCPDTRFILDHCGNANLQAKDRAQWQRDMTQFGKCKNVVGKVSGFIASARGGKWTVDELAPIVNHTLEAFGPDRVMFGGDWPVCTLAATFRQWVDALKAIVRTRKEADQRKLFHDNAVRFYGLK